MPAIHWNTLRCVFFCTGLLCAVGETSAEAKSPEKVLYSFNCCVDGAIPYGSLLLTKHGAQYGTTTAGGTAGFGAVYSLTNNGIESVLYSFQGGPDGGAPEDGLIADKRGNLYGTTSGDGANSNGTIFKLTAAGNETVLYRFTGSEDGGDPFAGLAMDAQGNLFGTAEEGGDTSCFSPYGCGVVFELTSKGEKVLHTFEGGADGSFPTGALLQAKDGNLYGTTSSGGTNGAGTIFKISNTGVETVLYSFSGGNDGGDPISGLVADESGDLYGTTLEGGTGAAGTVYKLDSTGTESIVYSFANGNDGGYPTGSLLLDGQGNCYGTTRLGGGGGKGTVFKLNSSGVETVLYNFTGGKDGGIPWGGLIWNKKSTALLGATSSGGTDGDGVIFSVKP